MENKIPFNTNQLISYNLNSTWFSPDPFNTKQNKRSCPSVFLTDNSSTFRLLSVLVIETPHETRHSHSCQQISRWLVRLCRLLIGWKPNIILYFVLLTFDHYLHISFNLFHTFKIYFPSSSESGESNFFIFSNCPISSLTSTAHISSSIISSSSRARRDCDVMENAVPCDVSWRDEPHELARLEISSRWREKNHSLMNSEIYRLYNLTNRWD